jgi:DNA-binding MarR family transcriptional regulator
MSQDDLIAIAEAVAGLMPRLARGFTSAEKDPADSLPLAQLRLCGVLSEGPRPMSAVCRELGVSHSALTQIADRLERANLVKRVAEENDRRVRCLQLTARGEKMMHKRRDARVRRTLAVLEHLAVQQREAVRLSLEILVEACAAVHTGEPKVATVAETLSNGRAARAATHNGHANNQKHPNNHNHETAPSPRSKPTATPNSTVNL